MYLLKDKRSAYDKKHIHNLVKTTLGPLFCHLLYLCFRSVLKLAVTGELYHLCRPFRSEKRAEKDQVSQLAGLILYCPSLFALIILLLLRVSRLEIEYLITGSVLIKDDTAVSPMFNINCTTTQPRLIVIAMITVFECSNCHFKVFYSVMFLMFHTKR